MVFNNLVKYILNDGGIIKDIYIDGKDSNGTGLCNASVLFINDELHIILRNVEYTLHHSEGQKKYQTRYEGPLSYYHRDDYLRLKTTNFYCKLDVDNLDIINYSEIDTTKLDVEPVWTFIGLEDARLVYWDNKYYACGVRRDTKTNGEGRMELSELEINENGPTPSVLSVKEVNRNRIQVENINSYCEKNWMPIKNKPFHFIKWSNPTEVVTVDLKTNSSKSIFRSDKTHDLPLDLRGGSQLIPWENNTYLAIVHECKFIPKNHNGYKDSAYYHRFVIWNDDFTINHISERFNFMTASIEFCIGLEEVNNNIVLIFGFQDNGCYILKINKQKFKNILFNTLKNGAHAPSSTHISQQQKQSLLVNVVNDPYNDLFNYNLARFYETLNQYAIAYSFYLRCAEFTDDKVLSSEALMRCSLCISKQKNRCQKELYLIKHAMTASPNSIEPYYVASLYFSWRSGNTPEKRFWLDSYMYACMGINILENNLQTTSFKNDIGYTKVNIYYQKAFAGSNIGKLDEAREIYTQILTTFEISDKIRELIIIKKQQLPEPSHPIATYTNNKLDSLKFYFKNCHKIEYNYSQIYQDMFTLSMHNGKNYGTYLEIGAGDYKYGNNTYLLEKEFDWSGISIDFNKAHVETFNNIRKNKCLCKDATKIDYIKLLNENYESTNIDYLQLECDPPNITFDILTKIPFDNYKFGVITYEHDYYNDNTGNYREKSRDFLKEKGYKLITGNISSYKDKCPFEDWWVHPELVDENIYKLFERNDDIPINREKYMLTKSKYVQEPISEISNKQDKIIITFGTDDLFKNKKIRFKQQATDINFFDSVIIEDEKTIKPLLKEHEEFIINNKRGYGYWIWKAFIIKNQLEKMKTNDILFYLDCGSSIINNNVERLDNYINILKDYDVMVFDNPDHKTKKNVKMNVINEFNIEDDILEQNLIEGGCIILKNTKKTKEFIDEWKRYMIKDNYQLVNDDLLNLPQHEEFMEHRHDQSILTILARQKDYVYVNNGLQELYNKGPLFHSRLTDIGPRKYAKPIPQYTYNNCSSTDIKYGVNKHTYKTPNLIVIDNFYENPDKIREYALSLNYQPPENHGAVGYRCESGRKIQEGTKELFEKLLHATIPGGNKKGSWDYSTNGCFQWCNAKTPIVYHSDEQQYAAIVYLTPNAPPNTGTSFFRHKKYKLRNSEVFSKSDWYQSDLNYKEPHLDKTQWETFDSIGNVYNRLVIFNAQYIHGVTEYFGEDINNSRLFQLFFFNKD